MSESQTWYVVKRQDGHCDIISSKQVEIQESEIIEQWGPITSQQEAIARRVGLIRSGKCQPV